MHMTSFLGFFREDFIAKECDLCDDDLAVEHAWILFEDWLPEHKLHSFRSIDKTS